MIPLKRRRLFARVYKKNLYSNVIIDDCAYEAKIKNVSASGCNLSFKDNSISIPLNSFVRVDFKFNNVDFSLKAQKVRKDSFSFVFEDKEDRTKLNNEILVEYFKDTPELCPVGEERK